MRVQTPCSSVNLDFRSDFEGGNLEAVFRRGEEYYLFTREDYFTRGFQQWFYFRVANLRPGHQYKFTIVQGERIDRSYVGGLKLPWVTVEGSTQNVCRETV